MKEDLMKILLLGIKPVSTNAMYRAVTRTINGRRKASIISSEELIQYKNDIHHAIRLNVVGKEPLDPRKLYTLKVEVSYPKDMFYYKNGNLKRLDASNAIKPLEDGIAEGVGVDDTQNMSVHIEKFYNDEGMFIVYAELLECQETDRLRGLGYYKSLV